jgi:hypothetical protein
MGGRQSPRWAFMAWLEIPDAYEPEKIYLKRLRIVQTPWFGVYLHWIYLPDRDRDPHDHPWTFASIVLRGGYGEEVIVPESPDPRTRMVVHRAPSVHIMRMWQAHRIRVLKPNTMTLVFTGPRKRVWGFWANKDFVPWDAYVNADGTRKTGPDPFDS